MQKAIKRNPSQILNNFLNQCIEFLVRLRSLNKSPNQIWCMDEKGLWSNDGPLRTIGKKNR